MNPFLSAGPSRSALVPLLADVWELAARTRVYQWNVVGPQFLYLAELFRKHYRELDEQVDTLAERVRVQGAIVPGPLADLLRQTRLPPRTSRQPGARDMVTHLLADHEAVMNQVRGALSGLREDRVTEELLVGILARHEHMARMLRAFLESPADAGA